MAKKTKSDPLVTMTKLTNQTQKELQKMVNSANTQQAKYNADEAKKSRDWQEKMSKTSHQMEVADLKKAGLNPVLSANSGAQSYTTSSASMTPESGASALANVQGSQISALGSMESSRISANAALKAAKAQAAAMKRAAEVSAAAQKYSTDKSYKARIYEADKASESAKYKVDTDKYIAMHKPAGSFAGLIDKALQNSGVDKLVTKHFKKGVVKPLNKFIEKMNNNPGAYFKNTGKITQGNFKLNSKGQKIFNNALKNAGVDVNKSNRRLLVRATVFRDKSSIKQFVKLMQKSRVSTPHHGYTSKPRRGHL